MNQGLGFPLLSPEKKCQIRADETLIIGLDWKKKCIFAVDLMNESAVCMQCIMLNVRVK